jgi:hypothetical protein
MRRAARIDLTQPEMVQFLMEGEYNVQNLSQVGGGCPDLLVGCPWGELVLVECKSPGGRLNAEQKRWHMAWHHLPRCMPKSVVELKGWLEKRKARFLRMTG